MASSFRLIPVTILAALLLLTVKVGGIWQEVTRIGPSPVAAQQAQPQQNQQQNPPQQNPPKPAAQRKDGDKPIDPILFSRSEIELLQELSRRREELDQREQTLIQKEGLLAAAEQRIEKRIGDLASIRGDIEGLIKKYNEQEEAELQRLVKIYEAMKPKDAAAIFNELDIAILLQVMERMAERRIAPILADMTPKRAQQVTTEIASRRPMPDLEAAVKP
ncbi:MAG: hypothetical protein KJ904_05325 [Alphaproteobacteria bacterium]|nr:hypothetical protein [Alphaproteobacteria bacterium]MBU0797027.1 hypothetical protein [Alphaproteobacteria bacterium]MBU0886567.1 hypothetical protein [Alphaproteobacteria bacterium]MBU1814155.1 hypothetical protein [Alphaproteobacteria bacterium]MBU2089825.1 hypothetical protein [Alphaproteobacteria bacterium]